jgi:hypothetical protein
LVARYRGRRGAEEVPASRAGMPARHSLLLTEVIPTPSMPVPDGPTLSTPRVVGETYLLPPRAASPPRRGPRTMGTRRNATGNTGASPTRPLGGAGVPRDRGPLSQREHPPLLSPRRRASPPPPPEGDAETAVRALQAIAGAREEAEQRRARRGRRPSPLRRSPSPAETDDETQEADFGAGEGELPVLESDIAQMDVEPRRSGRGRRARRARPRSSRGVESAPG